MPESVGMYREAQPSGYASPGNHLPHRRIGQWHLSLSREDVRAIRVIPLKAAECSQLRPLKRMAAGVAIVQPLYVE